jgi:CHAT domain-containing protein
MGPAMRCKRGFYARLMIIPLLLPLAILGPDRGNAQERGLVELDQRAAQLFGQDRFKEAAPLAEEAVKSAIKLFGEDHPQYAKRLYSLARIYFKLKDVNLNPVPLFRRALAINLAALGEQHHETAKTRNFLAFSIRELGCGCKLDYDEVESLLIHARMIYEKYPPDPEDEVFTLDILGGLYRYKLKQFDDAEPLYKRAIAIRENQFGHDHPEAAKSRAHLGHLYRDVGRHTEAESILKSALAVYDKRLDPDHEYIIHALDILAGLYRHFQARYGEAEPLLQRAINIRNRTAPESGPMAQSLSNLALLYREHQRYDESEPLLLRALAILEKTEGPEHLDLVHTLHTLAGLYSLQGRHKEAEAKFRRIIAICQTKLGADHPDTAIALGLFAANLGYQGQNDEAERLLHRAIGMLQKALGSNHPGIVETIELLTGLYSNLGRHMDAEASLRLVISINEKALSINHPMTADSYYKLGSFYSDLSDWGRALEYYDKSLGILMQRHESGVLSSSRVAQRQLSREVARNRERFVNYVRAAYRLSAKDSTRALDLRSKAYEVAQWALLSDTAGALAQMAARFASGSDALGRLVRDQQDLTIEWSKLDKGLAETLSKSVVRNEIADKQRSKLDAIETRLTDVVRELQGKFPEYAALSNPKPLSLADTQRLLRTDEALIQMMFTPEEGFAWVVTSGEVRWVRIDLTAKALEETVAALRCGLDPALWHRADWWSEDTKEQIVLKAAQIARRQRCVQLVKTEPKTEIIKTRDKETNVSLLPFDLERAHRLYKVLFDPVEDIVSGKHLLLVLSGPLTTLPFNVLITKPPRTQIPTKFAAYRAVSWLATRQAMTVLPSVASLQALRTHARASRANKVFLGIGNPLLEGNQEDYQLASHYKARAKAARDKQQCEPTITERIPSTARPPNSFTLPLRRAYAEIEEVRKWPPLPETADELCEIGLRLGVPKSDILLGSRATEADLKNLSESGQLADYSILHFATHGALTGQVLGSAESGLILSPPAAGTTALSTLQRDDGFLTASEIANLHLDADWVVLSACNTAGAENEHAQPLSGMARAFFFAGARALLVSHWDVDSHAVVKLTTRTFALLKSDKRIGRADAFRLAMRDLIQKGAPNEAHPSTWAPFVVAGEGSR